MGARCRHDLKTGQAVDVQFVKKRLSCVSGARTPGASGIVPASPWVRFTGRDVGRIGWAAANAAADSSDSHSISGFACPSEGDKSNRPADRRRNDEGIELRQYPAAAANRRGSAVAPRHLVSGWRRARSPINSFGAACKWSARARWSPRGNLSPSKSMQVRDGADRPLNVGRMPVDGACNSRNKPIQGTLMDGFCQVGLCRLEAMHDATGRGAGGVADHGEGGGLRSHDRQKRVAQHPRYVRVFPRLFYHAPATCSFWNVILEFGSRTLFENLEIRQPIDIACR